MDINESIKKASNPKEAIKLYAKVKREKEKLTKSLSTLEPETIRSGSFEKIYRDLTLALEEILMEIARPVQVRNDVFDISAYRKNRGQKGRKQKIDKAKKPKPKNEKRPLVTWAVDVAEELDEKFSIEKHFRAFNTPFKDAENLEFFERKIQDKRRYFAIILPTIKCKSLREKGRVILAMNERNWGQPLT